MNIENYLFLECFVLYTKQTLFLLLMNTLKHLCGSVLKKLNFKFDVNILLFSLYLADSRSHKTYVKFALIKTNKY